MSWTEDESRACLRLSTNRFSIDCHRFTTTPAAGLEDLYVAAGGALRTARAPTEWNVVLHDYRSDAGRLRYGRELDASIAQALGRGWRMTAKAAYYRADRHAVDTTKLWLQLEWSTPAR